jgi:hypothetical protein
MSIKIKIIFEERGYPEKTSKIVSTIETISFVVNRGLTAFINLII